MRTRYPTPLSARMTALSPAAGSRGSACWLPADTALLWQAQQGRITYCMSEYGISLNEGRLETTFCKKWPTLQHSKLNVQHYSRIPFEKVFQTSITVKGLSPGIEKETLHIYCVVVAIFV